MAYLDPNSLDKLRVVDLRKHLAERGLPTSCLKADLVRRLRESIESENSMKPRFYEAPMHVHREDTTDLMRPRFYERDTYVHRADTADLICPRFYDRNMHIPRADTTDLMCPRFYDRNVHVPRAVTTVLESADRLSRLTLESPTPKGCDCSSQSRGPLPSDKMVQDFKQLFLKQEDCDTTIKVQGQEFQVHRIILRARSPVFASTFRSDMKEKASGIVEIEDCDPTSFSDFLHFLYCGYLENLSTKNVFTLFTTADKYDVQDLRSECLEFMKKNISLDTFCDIVTLTFLHDEKELSGLATDFFGKNFQKIIVTDKWKSFLSENPMEGNEIMIKSLVSKK